MHRLSTAKVERGHRHYVLEAFRNYWWQRLCSQGQFLSDPTENTPPPSPPTDRAEMLIRLAIYRRVFAVISSQNAVLFLLVHAALLGDDGVVERRR